MTRLDPTAYNRLFHRLRVQALIQDLRRRFGQDRAFEIVADAIRLESGAGSKYTDATCHTRIHTSSTTPHRV